MFEDFHVLYTVCGWQGLMCLLSGTVSTFMGILIIKRQSAYKLRFIGLIVKKKKLRKVLASTVYHVLLYHLVAEWVQYVWMSFFHTRMSNFNMVLNSNLDHIYIYIYIDQKYILQRPLDYEVVIRDIPLFSGIEDGIFWRK